VIVEALSAGTPVVCSDCPGGPRSILGDGKYGRLVLPGSPRETADAILETLAAPPDAGILKARAGEYTVARVGAIYAQAMGIAL
jgi:glycosyltransferase involved in cell wall biosynthesis